MRFRRMPLESWFDKYQYLAKCNIGESAIPYKEFGELGLDLDGLRIRYGHHRGLPELRDRIAADYDGLTADDVVVTNGAAEALFCIAAWLLNPNDRVVVEHPNYASNIEVPRSLGCEVVLLSLEFEDGFALDVDKLEEVVTPKTKLMSLSHPNNPTGAIISQETLEACIEIAERNGCHLLFDETYRALTYGERLPAAASLSQQAISVSTLSKDYGLPGIRIGWLATQDRDLLDGVVAIREQTTICNSALGEAIAVTVLDREAEFIGPLRGHVRTNLDSLSAWMSEQEYLEWVPPESGVVCLPRFRAGAMEDPESFYRLLVEEYGTFLIPGRCFEMDNRYFRLGFGGDRSELVEGLGRFAAAYEALLSGSDAGAA